MLSYLLAKQLELLLQKIDETDHAGRRDQKNSPELHDGEDGGEKIHTTSAKNGAVCV
jgi:hypothetical protein